MFFSLLGVTFVVAIGVTTITVGLFGRHIDRILERIVSDELAAAWHRYILFAAYVVGISGGVNLHKLEQYVNARHIETTRSYICSDQDANLLRLEFGQRSQSSVLRQQRM